MPPHTSSLTVSFTRLLVSPSLWFSGMDGWFCFCVVVVLGLLWFQVHLHVLETVANTRRGMVGLGCVWVCFGTYHIVLCISLRAPAPPVPPPSHHHTHTHRQIYSSLKHNRNTHTHSQTLSWAACLSVSVVKHKCCLYLVLFCLSYALSLCACVVGLLFVGVVCVWFRVQLAWPESKRRRNRGEYWTLDCLRTNIE